MICRNCPQSGSVRLGVLARKINVSESSASKMVHKLSETGLVTFENTERYISPSEEGE